MHLSISFLPILMAILVSHCPWALATSTVVPQIVVDAGDIVGTLKNLQGTNNGLVPNDNDGLDMIDDVTPAIQQHWRDSAVGHVCIYTFPDVFLGVGLNGTAGDAYNIQNYNFTAADARVKFVVDGGAKASAQFQEGGSMTLYTAEQLEGMGYVLTQRYMNDAYGSGFTNAIELWDFYPEADNVYESGYEATYETNLALYTAFAKGVAAANTTAGCGAWGYKRLWTPSAPYTLPDPWKTQFFKDLVANKVPIRAATFHWDATSFSWDPYELVTATEQFRKLYLIPSGLPNLPIWVTEHNRNPLGILPTSSKGLAAYNDPASIASWVIAVAMYGQDAYVNQAWSWTGLGYGGYGYGDAYFQAWYNKTADGDVPTNTGSAWVLSGDFVTRTPNRLSLTGSSSNGFAALAGISNSKAEVQVMLNNYQVDYDMLREITDVFITKLNTSSAITAQPVLQPNGLYNGQQAALEIPGDTGVLGVFTCTQATIRNNTATSYHLTVNNLPWTSGTNYTAKIQRVGGGKTYQVYKTVTGTGTTFEMTLAFPPNAQDLVTVTATP